MKDDKPVEIKTFDLNGNPVKFKLYHPNKDKLAANCDKIHRENAEFAEKVKKGRIVSDEILNRHFTF
jgi:hypothetical protein